MRHHLLPALRLLCANMLIAALHRVIPKVGTPAPAAAATTQPSQRGVARKPRQVKRPQTADKRKAPSPAASACPLTEEEILLESLKVLSEFPSPLRPLAISKEISKRHGFDIKAALALKARLPKAWSRHCTSQRYPWVFRHSDGRYEITEDGRDQLVPPDEREA